MKTNIFMVLGLFIVGLPTAYAASQESEEVSISKIVKKLNRNSDAESIETLEVFSNYKENNKSHYTEFLQNIKAFKTNLKVGALALDVKNFKKACRPKNKIANPELCETLQAKVLTETKKYFLKDYITVGTTIGSYPDYFYGVFGEKLWDKNGSTSSVRLLGLGVQYAGALLTITACTQPGTRYARNYGFVASAVLGTGVTSGLYIGGNGVCFDFGIMYGIGAYAAFGEMEDGVQVSN